MPNVKLEDRSDEDLRVLYREAANEAKRHSSLAAEYLEGGDRVSRRRHLKRRSYWLKRQAQIEAAMMLAAHQGRLV